MANVKKKISELTSLTSASLDTVVVGVDNGTTYKIELDVLADGVRDRINTLDYQRLNSLETITASVNNNLSSLNSFTASQTALNTAFTNGINGRLTTSSFNSFSASVHSEILAATNEQSFNGLISGSSQLTSSYDSRYVLSGSITQTTWDNISGKPSGLVSQSTDLTSLNSFTASNGNTSLNAATSSYETKGNGIVSGSSQLTSSFDTRYAPSASYLTSLSGAISSSSQVIGILSSLNSVSASVISKTGSYATTGSNSFNGNQTVTGSINVQYNVQAGGYVQAPLFYNGGAIEIRSYYQPLQINSNGAGTIINDNVQITGSLSVSGSITGSTNFNTIVNKPTLVSGSSQLTSSLDLRYAISASYLTSLNGAFSSSIQTLGGSGVYSSSAQLPNGLISGSSQLTASFDTRYAPSASYLTSLNGAISSSTQITNGSGIVSGSSQLTASFDVRYALSGSGGSIPGGTISGSSQLTASFDLRYLVTGSVTSSILQLNTFTASNSNTSLNAWSSSVATTGSNSFNGNQVITGSLTITTGSFVASQLLANTSSLYLTSGSNMYVQNNGVVEITGSLLLSGSMSIQSGSITMSNRPAFRVIGTSSTNISTPSILSGSAVSVDYNEGGYYNTTNGRFTAPIAGLYHVYFNGRVGSINASMQAIVYKNTNVSSLMWESQTNTGASHFGVSGILKLAVNDTLEVKVTVGSIQFDANDNWGVSYIG